jgi:nitroimidazol reductase NimA-like FMN-containing flavoprotein (pyridoxamine 5'-phosphate oxidase superfamily)
MTSKLHESSEHMAQRPTTAASVSHDDLQSLDSTEASLLLASHHLGRLAFAFEGWPVVLPVNYVFDDPTIVIRTDLGAKLSAAPFHAVAFEVDDSGTLGEWGWSVLAQGPAFDITDADEAHCRLLRTLPVEPWAPGERDHWLMVTTVNLSGKRFGRVPELDGSAVRSSGEQSGDTR